VADADSVGLGTNGSDDEDIIDLTGTGNVEPDNCSAADKGGGGCDIKRCMKAGGGIGEVSVNGTG